VAKSIGILLCANAGIIMTKSLPNINDREQSIRQHINDLVLTDIEIFRAEATKAYNEYVPNERALLDNISTKDVTSYGVLAAWKDELLPLLSDLTDKQSDKTFYKFIAKNLAMDETTSQSKTSQIIKDRKNELINNFVFEIYPIQKGSKDIYKQQRERALKLLSRPIENIEQIKSHHINDIICKEIADRNKITIADTYDSFFKRKKAKSDIRSERKKTIKSENQRLEYIEKRLESLSATNDGLINKITNKKWDLMIILALRNQYEKSIGKLSKTDEKNAIKRLEIFDKETKDFKKEQAEKLIINSDQVSLETTRTIIKDIDGLLLQIFDLTTTQKNQLVLNIREYRELTQEKAAILQTRSNRAKYL